MFRIHLVFLFLFSNAYILKAQTNLTQGLIACFPFNGNARDASGNGNHGQAEGAKLTLDRFGKPNSAYRFNGSTEFIEVNPNQLKNDNFSFSIWVNISSTATINGPQYLISVGSKSGEQSITLNDGLGLTGFTGGGNISEANTIYAQNGILPTINRWYHIVLIRDNNFYGLYLDGKLLVNAATNGALPYYGTDFPRATIGRKVSGSGNFANGIIDDIHIYNRAINAQEVKLLYEGEKLPLPILNISKTDICAGDLLTFKVDGSSNSAKYLWKLNAASKETDTNTLEFTTENLAKEYELEVTVEVIDDAGCFPQKPAKIKNNYKIKNCRELFNLTIPNIFTPNDDGSNDVWEIVNLKNIPEATIAVFNRAGMVVFKSKGYAQPWDGKINGDPLPPDSYNYQISTSSTKIIRGTVVLVR
jgi:gliding motility-associated-like protein